MCTISHAYTVGCRDGFADFVVGLYTLYVVKVLFALEKLTTDDNQNVNLSLSDAVTYTIMIVDCGGFGEFGEFSLNFRKGGPSLPFPAVIRIS